MRCCRTLVDGEEKMVCVTLTETPVVVVEPRIASNGSGMGPSARVPSALPALLVCLSCVSREASLIGRRRQTMRGGRQWRGAPYSSLTRGPASARGSVLTRASLAQSQPGLGRPNPIAGAATRGPPFPATAIP